MSFRGVMGCVLLCAVSCTPATEPQRNGGNEAFADATPPPAKGVARDSHVIAPPRLSAEEFERFSIKARNGDIRAMHTLSVHYLSKSEVAKAYDWLRAAAKLGDCEAVIHLVDDDFGGVTPDEAPHWRNEQRRLRCDPRKNYGTRPTIRRHAN
jgi:hypothetical protein